MKAQLVESQRERLRRIEEGEHDRRRPEQVHRDRGLAADRRRRGRDPRRRPGRRGASRSPPSRSGARRATRPRSTPRSRTSRAVAKDDSQNIMEATIAAARAGATTGEWARALRDVFSSYRGPTGVGEAAMGAGDEHLDELRDEVERVSEALGRRLKILVGKPGPRRPFQRRRADRRARTRRRHGRRLRGHPPDAVADRALGGRRGRPRRRALDPVGLAPRADPRA